MCQVNLLLPFSCAGPLEAKKWIQVTLATPAPKERKKKDAKVCVCVGGGACYFCLRNQLDKAIQARSAMHTPHSPLVSLGLLQLPPVSWRKKILQCYPHNRNGHIRTKQRLSRYSNHRWWHAYKGHAHDSSRHRCRRHVWTRV